MIRLLPGDCCDVLATLPADSVHCVVDIADAIRYSRGMNDIPIEVLAYCAGVIDSDGSIGIRRSTYGMRVLKNRLTVGYWARICVKQVEPDAVLLMKGAFGGNLGIDPPNAKYGKQLHRWQIQNRQAVAMLRQLLPHLRIKRRQAENCLALHELIDGAVRSKVLGTRTLHHWAGKQVTVRTMGHTDEHVAACEALYLKGKQLNAVGVKGVRDDQTTVRGLSRGAANAA